MTMKLTLHQSQGAVREYEFTDNAAVAVVGAWVVANKVTSTDDIDSWMSQLLDGGHDDPSFCNVPDGVYWKSSALITCEGFWLTTNSKVKRPAINEKLELIVAIDNGEEVRTVLPLNKVGVWRDSSVEMFYAGSERIALSSWAR